eukprot:TRINITY_DN12228_c1_g5_i2.p1 TRINITY_DN12228_c1_g5~~TRINITY_DN12228_c1_g5_i2.p1  ORF type:complete len:620 (+),score=64.14 TRINITY_DN12228_c1_g5_i2:74-1933(+)
MEERVKAVVGVLRCVQTIRTKNLAHLDLALANLGVEINRDSAETTIPSATAVDIDTMRVFGDSLAQAKRSNGKAIKDLPLDRLLEATASICSDNHSLMKVIIQLLTSEFRRPDSTMKAPRDEFLYLKTSVVNDDETAAQPACQLYFYMYDQQPWQSVLQDLGIVQIVFTGLVAVDSKEDICKELIKILEQRLQRGGLPEHRPQDWNLAKAQALRLVVRSDKYEEFGVGTSGKDPFQLSVEQYRSFRKSINYDGSDPRILSLNEEGSRDSSIARNSPVNFDHPSGFPSIAGDFGELHLVEEIEGKSTLTMKESEILAAFSERPSDMRYPEITIWKQKHVEPAGRSTTTTVMPFSMRPRQSQYSASASELATGSAGDSDFGRSAAATTVTRPYSAARMAPAMNDPARAVDSWEHGSASYTNANPVPDPRLRMEWSVDEGFHTTRSISAWQDLVRSPLSTMNEAGTSSEHPHKVIPLTELQYKYPPRFAGTAQSREDGVQVVASDASASDLGEGEPIGPVDVIRQNAHQPSADASEATTAGLVLVAPPLQDWTEHQVTNWLFTSGAKQSTIAAFAEQHIDGKELSELDPNQLTQLGFTSFVLKRALAKARKGKTKATSLEKA